MLMWLSQGLILAQSHSGRDSDIANCYFGPFEDKKIVVLLIGIGDMNWSGKWVLIIKPTIPEEVDIVGGTSPSIAQILFC